MFNFTKPARVARALAGRGAEPEAATPSAVSASVDLSAHDRWAEAIASRDRAHAEYQRIVTLISENERGAQEIRGALASAESALAAATQAHTHLLAEAAVTAAMGEPGPEKDAIEVAGTRADAAKRDVEKASAATAKAEELEATARAFAPRLSAATDLLNAAHAAELDARRVALRESAETAIARYYAAAEAFMQAFYEMSEHERALGGLGAPLNIRTVDWREMTVPAAFGRDYPGRGAMQIQQRVRDAIEAKWGKVAPAVSWADIWTGKAPQSLYDRTKSA